MCLKYLNSSFMLHVEHIDLAQWLNKVREIFPEVNNFISGTMNVFVK